MRESREGNRVGAMSAALEAVACCVPLSAPVMTDEETNATAELFKVLGDPARVRIVNMIATAGVPVCACDFYDSRSGRSRAPRAAGVAASPSVAPRTPCRR